jgi:hypothetical protein
MNRMELFVLCLILQARYAEHLVQRAKSRHNSKRHTLRSHRQ